MIKTAYTQGQIHALARLGLTKQANDLAAQLAAAEGAAAVPAAVQGAQGMLAKLRAAKLPAKMGLGLGALAGGGVLAHQMAQDPQMEVVPSAPISPMFP